MSERADILQLIAERVRVRFSTLDADAFASYLSENLRGASESEGTPSQRFAALSLDDLYLAAACGLNDERAWEELAASHFRFMRQLARRYLPEPGAGDLADQVIADLWQRGKIARYAGRSTLRTWLGAIVAHAALNAVKSARARATVEDGAFERDRVEAVPTREPLEHERESSRLLAKLVVEVLADIPADDKLLLLMCYEQNLTLEEMRRALGGSRATLSRRLRDARERLWASLDALARRQLGASAESLKAGINLAPSDFDLEAAVGAVRTFDELRRDVV